MRKHRIKTRKGQKSKDTRKVGIDFDKPVVGSGVSTQQPRVAGNAQLGLYFIAILLVSIWIFMLYSNSFNGPFIFDDKPNILFNEAIHLKEFTTDGIKKAVYENPMTRRPIAYFSFALNYYFNGDRVFGYRVVNVIIHLFVGFALYLFTKTTLQTPAMTGRYKFPNEIAVTSALLFLVHPVATQTVAYVVQRMASLSALFYLLSMFCYAKARLAEGKVAWFWLGCFLSAILALGSKENAVMLPVFILLYEWYFFQDLRIKRSNRWFQCLIIGLATVFVIFLALWGGELADWILKGFKSREFTLSERLLTELRVVVYYLSLLFYPHPDRLNLDYDFSLSTSLLSPLSTLGSLILILSLFCFAIAYSRNRLLSFAILWYFGNLAIESTAIPLEIIYEHRTYLPFMMLFVIFSTFINQILHKWTWRLMVVGVLFFILSIWTSQRATLWGDDIEIWKDAINKSPNKARTHHNLGVVLRDKGWLNNAIPYFKNAIRLDPNYFHAHQNLGSALLKINQPEQALIHFTRSSEINPNYPVSHIGRGQALAKLGRPHEAIIAFEEVIRIEPDHYRVHGDLGAVLIEADRIEEAIKELSTGLKYDPDNASIHYNIGLALAQTNRSKEAIAHMRKAVDIDQKYVLALRNLSILLFNKGEIDEPITLLRKAARLSPEDAGIWSDLGMVLLTAGRKEEAIEFLRKALQLDPGLTSAQQRLQEAEGLL